MRPPPTPDMTGNSTVSSRCDNTIERTWIDQHRQRPRKCLAARRDWQDKSNEKGWY